MSNYNQVILMGNLTREPELRYTKGKTAVVEFGLAVNRKFKKQDGQEGDEKLFIECLCYGKRAEVISKHFAKGDPIFVTGRLMFEQWEHEDRKYSRIRSNIERFEFVGSRGGN
jgi:single-strand DNA-binding protein